MTMNEIMKIKNALLDQVRDGNLSDYDEGFNFGLMKAYQTILKLVAEEDEV